MYFFFNFLLASNIFQFSYNCENQIKIKKVAFFGTQVCSWNTAIENPGFEILEHPPYSPNLTSSDFYLFPRLNLEQKLERHKTWRWVNKTVKTAVNQFFMRQRCRLFSKGILALEKRYYVKRINLRDDSWLSRKIK